jgi:hypothetical protein
MGNSKAIGAAYEDQDLVGSTITDATIVDPTITGATLEATSQTVETLIVSSAAAFFSVTAAIAQPSGAAQAAVATDAATTGAATYGLTSAQMNGMVALVNSMRSALVALGLIKGS